MILIEVVQNVKIKFTILRSLSFSCNRLLLKSTGILPYQYRSGVKTHANNKKVVCTQNLSKPATDTKTQSL